MSPTAASSSTTASLSVASIGIIRGRFMLNFVTAFTTEESKLEIIEEMDFKTASSKAQRLQATKQLRFVSGYAFRHTADAEFLPAPSGAAGLRTGLVDMLNSFHSSSPRIVLLFMCAVLVWSPHACYPVPSHPPAP